MRPRRPLVLVALAAPSALAQDAREGLPPG